ncbi:hypothetical protein [Dictyobacter aurantiacus]|uniref:Uncharacterized protein n=1 Tax=Dictyobacter aurantiacus TaxID=1936993 RepID=A0A401ZGK4_9CHLR|nr:hypothetical protein [Dictyobacter aurantiacus]GCE06015.1 hypothetical protein KDAU_33440 [Dictyobacter aurantiacus]
MDEKQEIKDGGRPRIQVADCAFVQVAEGQDYVVYQTCEPRALADIAIDLFLEHVLDKGWWGGIRLNGRFAMQLKLDPRTLFPNAEIALSATEEFLAREHNVREAFNEMKEQKQSRLTFYHVPPRPADVDPVRYFSPPVLEVSGIMFTLYHLTNTEAAYRSWERRQIAGTITGLRLAHVYGKGWQAFLRFSDTQSVMFEPAVDQLFLTPEHALETLFACCDEEERIRDLVQQLGSVDPQATVVITRDSVPEVTVRSPMRIGNTDYIWQRQMSQGQLYQAKQTTRVNFHKVYIQLIETWSKGWLAGVHFRDVSDIYFEKDKDVGFATPEEAVAAARSFIALKTEGWRMLYHAHNERIALQCRIGRYDQIISISQEG